MGNSLISVTKEGTATVLSFNTESLDMSNSKKILLELELQSAGVDCQGLIIDLGSITHIDSSGISVILAMKRKMPSNCSMSLRVTSPQILDVFKVLNVDQFFTFIS